MRFHSLLNQAGLPISEKDFHVIDITVNHRQVRPGSLFVAVKGAKLDGHDFIPQAVAAGALGVICESAKYTAVNEVIVSNSRQALGKLADVFFGSPSKQLKCIGVTGTNGKTSVTLMLEKILNDAGQQTGVMGTVDHHCGSKRWASELTTPDTVTLQKRLRDFVECGAVVAAMEVSSHALSQGRADSVPFDVAIFTNLSRDHMDYHLNVNDYFEAKNRLFEELLSSQKTFGVAVLNADDPWSAKIRTQKSSKKLFYGTSQCDFQFRPLENSFQQTEFELQAGEQTYTAALQLIGTHTVYNAVAAIAAAHVLGVPIADAISSLRNFTEIPGRLQPVPNDKGLKVFVDYAHTDDALRASLQALHTVRSNNSQLHDCFIHLVFGCGGDRDKGKRPLMGKVADELADWIYLTSDNPRTEDPSAILRDISTGIRNNANDRVRVIENRRAAIEEALKNAKKGDVVLIAGKGHEDYQIIGSTKHHFSDFEVAAEILDGM